MLVNGEVRFRIRRQIIETNCEGSCVNSLLSSVSEIWVQLFTVSVQYEQELLLTCKCRETISSFSVSYGDFLSLKHFPTHTPIRSPTTKMRRSKFDECDFTYIRVPNALVSSESGLFSTMPFSRSIIGWLGLTSSVTCSKTHTHAHARAFAHTSIERGNQHQMSIIQSLIQNQKIEVQAFASAAI